MPAKILCMASAKGGSGKTVLTATFGAFLSAIGKKILLVDTDAPTNGLTLLYLKEVMTRSEIAVAGSRQPKGTYELSDSDCQPEIVELVNGCHVIPATYGFMNTDLKSVEVYQRALAKMLANLREGYDYIILDAQAGSDAFAQVAMSSKVSDEVVIVSEYDPMSAAGVERLKGYVGKTLLMSGLGFCLTRCFPSL